MTDAIRPTTWVCAACGKTSPDRYGNHPDTTYGWDVSCFMNAVESYVDTLERGTDGRVQKCEAVK